jgi:heat shock protein HslJ
MMACEPPLMSLEGAVMRALAGTFRAEVRERSLMLTTPAGQVLAFEEAAAPSLGGVKWKVTGYNNGRQAVVSTLGNVSPWMQFAGGAVKGHAGCNTFRGTFTVDGDRVAVGPLVTTRKMCAQPDVMAQEQKFLEALRSATKWTIDARGMLDMHRADGERALTARASE